MCRFLLVKSSTPIQPSELLNRFADMAYISKAPDGDWQGDGWGISWFEENKWEKYSSLVPVWEDRSKFDSFPKSKLFMVHARSASFTQHKGNIEFNQPYINDQYSFVFNGLLKGISFPNPLAGTIGAQKIFSLLMQKIQRQGISIGFPTAMELLNRHTTHVQALNVGVSDGKNIYAYTQFAEHEEYYSLRVHTTKTVTLICSQTLEGYDFEKLEQKKVYSY